MGDYQDFCEMYGGSAGDPDFFDNWLSEYASGEQIIQKVTNKDILPIGKLVHIIKLVATVPAKPVGVIWNKTLEKPLECYEANYLTSTEYEDPASWLVRNGFIVRSIKIQGFWYQVAYKRDNNQTYLSVRETKAYEAICTELNSEWVKNIRN